jgi:uncharacterized protein
MSLQRLPEQIIPFKLARQRRSLQGLLKLEKMERLTALLADGHGDVAVDLQFGVDEQRISYMRGHLSAEVSMTCQRCMGPVTVPLEADIAVGFVLSDERASLMPDGYEPCLLMDETVMLADLIEDELILVMPIVAVHPEQSCQPWFQVQQEELCAIEVVAQEIVEKKNPFAVLASLKRDK